jgi:hypothetical protein
MGTYATTTSFSTWMLGTSLDTATTALIGQCITWAENEIDKRLAKRYDVAGFRVSVPPLVRGLTEQLATGYFYRHNARGGKEPMTRGEPIIKSVMENLTDLSQGKLEIVDSSGNIISPRTTLAGVLCNTSDYDPTFAEDSELAWAVDPDKLDDISDTRD